MSEILDIFGVDWRLLLVQAFNFGVLLVILSYLLYRPLLSLLEKRQAIITEGVRNAEKAGEELKKVAHEKNLILSEAARDAETIIERAKQRGVDKEENILKEAQVRSERMIREAEARATEEKRKALEGAREEMARMIVLGSEKILRKE